MERLYRSETDRVIAGVCGGLGAYLRIDPLILRILFVVLAMVNGIGLFVYLVLWIVVPSSDAVQAQQDEMIRHNVNEIGARARAFGQEARSAFQSHRAQRQVGGADHAEQRAIIGGAILIGLGLLILMSNFGLLWWVSLARLWPLVLIGVGLVILLNTIKDRH
ncbi:MAG TPA: PspC domain-containing protein [Chloroflexi bacterium]|jgi:phage shock protein C|nr:PspC domain-containing protein [Chloroflexota bacterium]